MNNSMNSNYESIFLLKPQLWVDWYLISGNYENDMQFDVLRNGNQYSYGHPSSTGHGA